jgi:hypothetical protein
MQRIIILLVLFGLVSYSHPNKVKFSSLDSDHNALVKDTLPVLKKDSVSTAIEKDTVHKKLQGPIVKDSVKVESQKNLNTDLDKIMKRNGDSILCKIISHNLYEVEYLKPPSKAKIKLSTANIKEIFYANGKYELIDNTPEKKKKDWTVTSAEVEWKNITITYEPTDVTGLIEKGQVDAFFEAKRMSSENELLERNAYSILKKKAYSMKATIVLITSKKFNRMYGEMPSITVIATAYGKE